MKKIIIILLLTTGLFSNCKTELVALDSGAENAVDYALKGNHKYALIEINSAITYGTQALESCKGKISSDEMDEISKNLASLKNTKKKIEKKYGYKTSINSQVNETEDIVVIERHKIEVKLKHNRKGVKTYFEGTTNLPEHTKIGIQLNGKALDPNIYIKEDGSFVSTGFTNLGYPLVGEYKVVIMVYNNNIAQTKNIQEKLEEYGVKKKSNIKIIKNFSF